MVSGRPYLLLLLERRHLEHGIESGRRLGNHDCLLAQFEPILRLQRPLGSGDAADCNLHPTHRLETELPLAHSLQFEVPTGNRRIAQLDILVTAMTDRDDGMLKNLLVELLPALSVFVKMSNEDLHSGLPVKENHEHVHDERRQHSNGERHVDVEPDLEPALQAYIPA